MTNKILIISICAMVGGIVLLAAGYLVGVGLEQQKTGPQLEKLEKATNALKSLSSSKVVPSITAIGKVTKISGRNVTLSNGEESIEVYIKENAKIYSSQTEKTFDTIKVGDNLSLRIKVLLDGQIEGSVVIIIPTL